MVRFPVRNSLSSSSLLIRLQINFHIIYFSNHFPYYYFNSRENDSLLNIARINIRYIYFGKFTNIKIIAPLDPLRHIFAN